eukprot:3795873-Amphidinium_carterae.1
MAGLATTHVVEATPSLKLFRPSAHAMPSRHSLTMTAESNKLGSSKSRGVQFDRQKEPKLVFT